MLKNQQRRVSMFSRVVFLTVGTLLLTDGAPVAAGSPAAGAQEVRELLAASRGVAPAMCTLAADGLFNWGGRWSAPAEAVKSDIRSRVRKMHRHALSADESQTLIGSIGSADACERH